jgi:hypothetical protein
MHPNATAVTRNNVFESLRTKWNLRFGFMSSDEDPRGPEVEESPGNEYAFTVTNDEEMVGSLEIHRLLQPCVFVS